MQGSLLTSEFYEPYAQALFSLGQSQNLIDQMSGDVSLILQALSGSEELNAFFGNPFIKDDVKKGVIRQMFGDSIHSYTQNFLQLLVDRRRITFLAGICKEFQAQVRKLNGTVLAEVTSAIELNDGQQQAIRERVIGLTGARQVELKIHLDPNLIGGVIIKTGSQVIDSSLRGQLRRFAYRLSGAR
jgi:F-type H+-transporting ATPase subunit delta